jgi:hypothetical protein
MASFFRQLSKGAKSFGRTLGRDAQHFGRQLSTTSQKIGHGIGKAQGFVSNLERKAHGIPVVGDVIHGANLGLSALHNVADIGVAGGQGLTALSRGDLKGAVRAGKTIINEGKQTAGLGGDLFKTATPYIAML